MVYRNPKPYSCKHIIGRQSQHKIERATLMVPKILAKQNESDQTTSIDIYPSAVVPSSTDTPTLKNEMRLWNKTGWIFF